ncbi:MAG: UDP-N-acetylmuramoyl-L-alanine--D-glutamate ligase [Candidatus Paceibacterota bacterium]|jgi:UDP-N-acetylmuramoylalanine--D-glutamate ligase
MNYKEYFKNKKITILGLGVLGRGVGDTKFLAECGADLIVTDLKKAEELKESLDQLTGFSNITFVLGEHRLEDFKGRDMILKSAGVPLDSPYIAEAQKNNVPVEMSSSLFARLSPATIVGVTGTRGKSTVAFLIHHILTTAYAGSDTKIFLGGNIRGVATLPFLAEANADDIAVLELDSWQLQGFGSAHISPHIAVFTNLLKDHLNYYMKGGIPEDEAMKMYFEDKANIFKYQTDEDVLVVGESLTPMLEEKYLQFSGRAIIAQTEKIPKSWKSNLLGQHNQANIACAIAVAEMLGIEPKMIRSAVASFAGAPGRLELVREWNGVKIYNDTNSTTPDSTIAGLLALKKVKVLIMGGADKKLDMTKLVDSIPVYVENIILLPGTGTDTIKNQIKNVHMEETSSLKEALEKALTLCGQGDMLLFSPGFASFGLFKNEYDRGDQFNAIVKSLN